MKNRSTSSLSPRRASTELRRKRWSRWRVLQKTFNILLGLAFIAGTLMLFPPAHPTPQYEFKLGDVTQAGEEVVAPVDFAVPVNPNVLVDSRAAASLAIPPLYLYDPLVGQQLHNRLNKLEQDIVASESMDSLADPSQRVIQLQALHPGLSNIVLETLLRRGDEVGLLARVQECTDSLLERGIVDTKSPLAPGLLSNPRLTLVFSDGERVVPSQRVVSQLDLGVLLADIAGDIEDWDPALASAFVSLARTHLRPNCFYDSEQTDIRRRAAAGAVSDEIEIKMGDRILDVNVQVTQDHLDQLRALEDALGRLSLDRWQLAAVVYAGHALLLGFVLALAIQLLIIYRADFFEDSRRVAFQVGLLLVFFLASKFALENESTGPYLVPITFVGMIVAGLFDVVLAMMATAFALLVLGLVAPIAMSGIVVGILAGGAAIFSIRQLRDRLQLYKSVLYVALAYLLSITVVHIAGGEYRGLLPDVLKGMVNGVVCAMLVMPILPLMERFLDITTSFTLLELTDLNRPILKRMKVEAPGTFQHSLAVSNLAEAAADAIDADPLLAKVCAYYHDIGKLAKPEYFAENQLGLKNPHNKLKPNMSSLVISEHVKKGLDEADKIALPSIVRRGIPEHHGTTVMQYFYRKAQEQDPHGKVRADDFRYPGPKPQSPETAILMLADSVEATVRSLDAPNAAKIRGVVTETIEKRLREGELEECNLSIKDLARIRESFITTLLSIYHPRIQYPSDKESPPAEGSNGLSAERNRPRNHATDSSSKSRVSGGI